MVNVIPGRRRKGLCMEFVIASMDPRDMKLYHNAGKKCQMKERYEVLFGSADVLLTINQINVIRYVLRRKLKTALAGST